MLLDYLKLIHRYWKLGVVALLDLFLLIIVAAEGLATYSGFFFVILVALISYGYLSFQSSKYGGFGNWRIASSKKKSQETLEKIQRERNLRRIRIEAEERADPDAQIEAGPFRKGSTTRYPSSSVYSYHSQQGKIPVSTVPCKDCEGKGRVEVVIRQNLVGSNEIKSFLCNRCQGSGFLAVP